GRYFATCDGGAGKVRLWDLAPDARSDHWAAARTRVSSLDVASGSRQLVAPTGDGIKVWASGRPSPVSAVPAPSPVGIAVSTSGQWIGVVGRTESGVWDSRTGQQVATLPGAKIGRVVRFSDDDRRIVIGETDGALAVWDWQNAVATGPRRISSEGGEVFALA